MIKYHFQTHKDLQTLQGTNFFNHYEIIELIGTSSNQVLLVQNNQGQQFAIKEIIAPLESIRKEISFLSNLNHQYIIKLIDSCILAKQEDYSYQVMGYILMEKANSNLAQFKQNTSTIPPSLIDQTLAAFDYLQSHSIAHCDIKPANILVFEGGVGEDKYIFKVCDVGSSKHDYSLIVNETVGTLQYMSPEMLKHEVQDLVLSDVYSLGLLYLHMFFNKKFKAKDRQLLSPQSLQNQIDAVLDANSGEKIAKLLKKMLLINPKERLPFDKLRKYWGALQNIYRPKLEMLPQINQEKSNSESPQRKHTVSQYTTLNTQMKKSEFKIRRTPMKSNQINIIDFFANTQNKQSPLRMCTPLKLSPLTKKRMKYPQQQQQQFVLKLQN